MGDTDEKSENYYTVALSLFHVICTYIDGLALSLSGWLLNKRVVQKEDEFLKI